MTRWWLVVTFVVAVVAACGSRGGLGARCDTNADCKSPMVCNWRAAATKPKETQDIAVCTMSCSASSQCKDAFGDDAFCNGYGVCAQGCRQDADCPPQTYCEDHYFCGR